MNPRAADTLADLYDAQYRRTLLLLLSFVILAVLFLLTQQRTLQRIKPKNRSMLPGLVWLQLIPVIGQLWQFFVVVRIAGSIRREMAARHEDPIFGADALIIEQGNKRPTLWIGLAYCILTASSILLSFSVNFVLLMTTGSRVDDNSNVNVVVALLLIAGIVCWLIYWIILGVWTRRLKDRSRPI